MAARSAGMVTPPCAVADQAVHPDRGIDRLCRRPCRVHGTGTGDDRRAHLDGTCPPSPEPEETGRDRLHHDRGHDPAHLAEKDPRHPSRGRRTRRRTCPRTPSMQSNRAAAHAQPPARRRPRAPLTEGTRCSPRRPPPSNPRLTSLVRQATRPTDDGVARPATRNPHASEPRSGRSPPGVQAASVPQGGRAELAPACRPRAPREQTDAA